MNSPESKALVDKLIDETPPHVMVFEPNEVAILRRWAAFMLVVDGAAPLVRMLYKFILNVAPFVGGAYLVWKYGLVNGITSWFRG